MTDGSTRAMKRLVREMLTDPGAAGRLEELRKFPPKKVINPLFSLLLSGREEVKWRAVAAMGIVSADLAHEDLEEARIVMRRLMWSLNDESGGIGWGAPEAMGEIAARDEVLAREYTPIIASYLREDGNFLEIDQLRRGALWALGRVASVRPEIVRKVLPYVSPYLKSRGDAERGLAAWIFSMFVNETGREELSPLAHDNALFTLYRDGDLKTVRIGDMVEKALRG
jgi:hypothetical protein